MHTGKMRGVFGQDVHVCCAASSAGLEARVCLQIQSHCRDLDTILDSVLQPQAKMAASSVQETDARFKRAEEEVEDVFSQAAHALLERKAQALEELRSLWKADRLEMEEQAAGCDSRVSNAKTSSALGRTVSSWGLPTQVLSQEQELGRVVKEARPDKPLQSPPDYKVGVVTTRWVS